MIGWQNRHPFLVGIEMRETIVHTEEIYDGRVVNLLIHEVRLPDGKPARREVVRHPGAVAMVALDEEQNVLLVRQYRIAADRMMLEIPAGTLEPDESPDICAVRELREETGYKPARLRSLGGVYVAPGYTSEFIHLYLATDLEESALQADDDESIEVKRLPLGEALRMVEQGEIVDGKTVVALLLVARQFGL
jgi:ADP-ribose pyrophosphatase